MFKDTAEFNKAWNYFVETQNRDIASVREWWLQGDDQVPWPSHQNTKTFQWCVETFKMWEEFKKGWDKIKDSISDSYSYKKGYRPKDEQIEKQREEQLNLFNS